MRISASKFKCSKTRPKSQTALGSSLRPVWWPKNTLARFVWKLMLTTHLRNRCWTQSHRCLHRLPPSFRRPTTLVLPCNFVVPRPVDVPLSYAPPTIRARLARGTLVWETTTKPSYLRPPERISCIGTGRHGGARPSIATQWGWGPLSSTNPPSTPCTSTHVLKPSSGSTRTNA